MTALMRRSSSDLRDPDLPRRWEGLAEIDQAISGNRIIQNRIGKAWADPWERKLTIAGTTIIIAVFAFLAGAAFGFW